jgi:DUF4097 and DUF4098 domain-containing protein YvlB
MAAQRGRPSLLGGLLWTGFGAAFLLHNFSLGPDPWRIIGRYWPILLILLGLGKVIDYYRRKGGVALRVGDIISILFLVAIGTAVTKISDSRLADVFRDLPVNIGGSSVRPGQWIGTSYAYTQESTYRVNPSTPLRIENSYGSVSVSPGSEGEMRVILKTVVYENDETKAKEISGQVKLQGTPQGKAEANAFIISTNRDEVSAKDYRFNTDMEVYIPRAAQLEVKNSYGELRVSNLEGKLDLSTTHNTLDVRDCKGSCTVANRFADTRLSGINGNVVVDARGRVSLETIKGDVTVTNEYAAVDINDVDGKVNITNTEGSIRLEKITKPVVIEARGTQVTATNLSDTAKISTSHRQVRLTDIGSNVWLSTQYSPGANLRDVRGNVDIESNSDRVTLDSIRGYVKVKGRGTSVRATSVEGPVDIQTTLRDVIVKDFMNTCSITNEYGDVSLTAAKLAKDGITVTSKNGDIDLYVPADAGFQLNAATRDGHVESDLAGLLPAEAAPDRNTLKGKVKNGGPSISLQTEYGNVRIRTRGSESRNETR